MLTTEWGDFGGDGWMGRSHAEPPGFTPPPPFRGTRILGTRSRLRDEWASLSIFLSSDSQVQKAASNTVESVGGLVSDLSC